MKNYKSSIFALITVFLWASTAAIVKLLLNDLSSIQVTFYSFIFTLIGLFAIVAFEKKLPLLKKYTKTDYLRMMGISVLGCYLYYVFLFGALEYAPAQEAFIVNYLWPIMVVIFGIIILKEKLSVKKILGLLVSFLGVYLVAAKGFGFIFENPKGDILAILGAISYGLFSILCKKYKYEASTSTLIYYFFGFILVTITTFFFSHIEAVSFYEILGLAWLGIVVNGVGFIFWIKALEQGETAKIANLIFLTPFLSLVYIHFLLGEKILISSILGLILIIAGVFIQSLGKESA